MVKLNLPNLLTCLRLSLIPVFVLVFYLPFNWHYLASSIIFIVAAITDWLDGYLARLWQQESALGKFLDPVADKLIVAVALVLLVQSHATPWLALPAAIIISREIVISALREWMAELGKRSHVAVSYLGKLKTCLQMVAIAMLLTGSLAEPNKLVICGYIFLYIAVVLTLWSMMIYVKAAWRELVDEK